MDKITEIKLQCPIMVDGEEVLVLKIRRPKGKDYRAMGNFNKPISAILDFAAVLADVPPSSIDQLDADDVQNVTEVVSRFLEKSPVTGPKL